MGGQIPPTIYNFFKKKFCSGKDPEQLLHEYFEEIVERVTMEVRNSIINQNNPIENTSTSKSSPKINLDKTEELQQDVNSPVVPQENNNVSMEKENEKKLIEKEKQEKESKREKLITESDEIQPPPASVIKTVRAHEDAKE